MLIEPQTALGYLAAGLSVLPAIHEKKHPAIGSWSKWQEHLPTESEVRAWFANKQDAVCIVCGKVSGNLEVIDFDNHGELYEVWCNAVGRELLARLVMERTPSGGYHAVYRTESPIGGNLKLAQGIRDGKLVTLIETRGNGGLFLCTPTDGYSLIQGSFEHLPVLNDEERKMLVNAAYELNEKTQGEAKQPPDNAGDSQFDLRPGDDFNARGDFRGLLIHHGWKTLGTQPDGNELWQRPGKDGTQNSATLKDGVFYVFSSNAAPFEPNTAYSPFNAYALLEHHGDHVKAAANLLECGYGRAKELPLANLTPFLSKVAGGPAPPKAPTIRSLAQLMTDFPAMKPVLIQGLLRIGETMNIIAPPKTGKSWLVTDLAAAVALGTQWFGFPCEQGKVLIMDNELHPETSSSRIPLVIAARKYPMKVVERNLFIENQRGRLQNINDIAERLEELKEYGFKLIIIDAFYRAMPSGMTENDNAQMAGIYNRLDSYAAALNCAFVLIHHTSKGNQANKSVTDVGAGAGSQSRAADAHIVLRRHDEPDAVVMESAVRSFPPVAPMGLRWKFPLWDQDFTLDTEKLEGKLEEPAPKGEKPSLEDMAHEAVTFLNEPVMKTNFNMMLRDDLGISKNCAADVIEYAICLGLIKEEKIQDSNNKAVHRKMLTKAHGTI